MSRNLVWVDDETTGLDPNVCELLEIGVIITTPGLKELARVNYVFHFDVTTQVDHIDEYVLNMHEGNGLWAECLESKIDPQDIEQDLIDLCTRHNALKGPMCGSTVSFDRRFNELELSRFTKEVFNHRHIDVSSYSEFAKMHGISRPYTPGGHRALSDLETSIHTLADYWNAMRFADDIAPELQV